LACKSSPKSRLWTQKASLCYTRPMRPDPQAVPADARELLHARGVYDIDHHGWINEEEIDPEFAGYVMWLQDPPYEYDVMGWQYNTPPTTAPTEKQQRLMELGSDFFGLMKTARHFIGHALLYQPHVPWLRLEPTEFDFSEFAALRAFAASGVELHYLVEKLRILLKLCLLSELGCTPEKRQEIITRHLRFSGLLQAGHRIESASNEAATEPSKSE